MVKTRTASYSQRIGWKYGVSHLYRRHDPIGRKPTMRLIKMEILGLTNEDRPRVCNKNYAKFRCSKVRVLEIVNASGKKMSEAWSPLNKPLRYLSGRTQTPHNVYSDSDRVCAAGIHYFKTKAAAREFYAENTTRWAIRGRFGCGAKRVFGQAVCVCGEHE